MPTTTRTVKPGPRPRTVRTDGGDVLDVPAGWELLPPGDAAVTRRLKASGPTWTVEEARGRKRFSQGVWAPAERIAAARRSVDATRADPAYERKLAADRARRERAERDYAREFARAVTAFLAFHDDHAAVATEVAARVAAHATPVGSGTVARTKRISVSERAEAAVIAWMRHQTTAYDHMTIARVKGERREVRRRLAQRSREVLAAYRRGAPIGPDCPLARALAKPAPAPPATADPDAPIKPLRSVSPRPRPSPPPNPRPAPSPSPSPPPNPRPPPSLPSTNPPSLPPSSDSEAARRAAKQAAVRARRARR